MMFLFINIGRIHPLVIHLPIGIYLLLLILEFYKWKWKNNDLDPAIKIALISSFLGGMLSCFTGYFLSQESGYDIDSYGLHRNLGIGFTVVVGLLYLIKYHSKYDRKLHFPFLFLSFLLMTITGHLGGSLTHGENFLFTQPVDRTISKIDIYKSNAFHELIKPILSKKCISCHSLKKAKGDLILSGYDHIMEGGKTGSLFDFTEVEKSLILERIHLDPNEKEHMPPKGKPQLNTDEKVLLKWWIVNNSCNDCIVENMDSVQTVVHILKKYSSVAVNPDEIKYKLISEEKINELNLAGIKTTRLSDSNPQLRVDLSHQKNISEIPLKKLRKVRDNIVEVDFSYTELGDKEAEILNDFSKIQKISLQKTNVGDKTIKRLRKLKYLTSLNLYGTKITDQSLSYFPEIKAIKKVFVYETNISDSMAQVFIIENPSVAFSHGIDENVFGKAALFAPTIKTDSKLFQDSIQVQLISNFRKAKVYYTTDGSLPDSNSIEYISPFVINESTKIQAIAMRNGWIDSPVSEEYLKTKGFDIRNVSLSNRPSKKYNGQGKKSLIDLKKGSSEITDGNWLGFEGSNLTVYIDLLINEEINNISLSTMSAQNSWIFFPRNISISVGKTGKNYKKVAYKEVALRQIPEQIETCIDIPIDGVIGRKIKIVIGGQLKNPTWHAAPGGKSWLFLDEILVE